MKIFNKNLNDFDADKDLIFGVLASNYSTFKELRTDSYIQSKEVVVNAISLLD